MRRRSARTDSNQVDIVRALRAAGFSVRDTSAVGEGFPDLVVGTRGTSTLVEVKDGAKDATHRALTAPQIEFFRLWKGRAIVVRSVAEALCALGVQRHQGKQHDGYCGCGAVEEPEWFKLEVEQREAKRRADALARRRAAKASR